MNAIALLVGLITYAVLGLACGLMVLGVGFMPEPSRSVYGHIIVLAPLLISGLVVAFIATSKSSAMALAALLALFAFAAFLALASGPIPYFFREQPEPWARYLQGSYQLSMYLATSLAGAWLGSFLAVAVGRRPRAGSTTCAS
jgi:hypothetical protein